MDKSNNRKLNDRNPNYYPLTTNYYLGIDTSTSILDIAIIDSKGFCLASETSNNEKTHSERAMPAIDSVLKKANLSINDIDIFAACIGPGSYTGVRIGVSIAKGLALATNKEYKTISSFDLMVHPKNPLAIPIIDARRGAVFTNLMGKNTRIDLAELKEKLNGQNYKFIEPHAGKWEGITPNMLGNEEIIYLGGSI